MTSNDKARLLGLLFWAYTALNVLLVLGIAVVYLAIVGVIFSTTPQRAEDPPPEVIVAIIAVVFSVVLAFTVLFLVPKLVAGYGLRKKKPWARTWTIVASIMACMSFPLGTAIGVFGLIFLFSDEGKFYFDQVARNAGQLSGVASPVIPQPSSWR